MNDSIEVLSKWALLTAKHCSMIRWIISARMHTPHAIAKHFLWLKQSQGKLIDLSDAQRFRWFNDPLNGDHELTPKQISLNSVV